jgi:hypothetical protein
MGFFAECVAVYCDIYTAIEAIVDTNFDRITALANPKTV